MDLFFENQNRRLSKLSYISNYSYKSQQLSGNYYFSLIIKIILFKFIIIYRQNR